MGLIKQTNRYGPVLMIFGLLTFVFAQPLVIANASDRVDAQTTETILSAKGQTDYLHWSGLFADWAKISPAELQAKWQLIADEGETSMTENELEELLGKPAANEVINESHFLIYYAEGEQASYILTLQLYPAEEGAEATLTYAELEVRQPHDFQALNLSAADLNRWRTLSALPTSEAIQAQLGEPSISGIDFFSRERTLIWQRHASLLPSINLVALRENHQGGLLELQVGEETLYQLDAN